jgi:hypothetical protein
VRSRSRCLTIPSRGCLAGYAVKPPLMSNVRSQMPATWKQLAFVPSSEALHELRDGWRWLIGEALEPFMASASGDVFLESEDGAIFWLDTGAGKLTRIAENHEAFLAELRTEAGSDWLLAPVIDKLVDSGISLGVDQCFAYKVLPLLGGSYTPENMKPMSAGAWYGFTGSVHAQLKDLPDGAKVSFKFDET